MVYDEAAYPTAWPLPLQQFLAARCGLPLTWTMLGGLSGAQVWCVHTRTDDLVVKRCSTREALFYSELAPQLRVEEIAIPTLHWATITENDAWVVLSLIGAALPRLRWVADPEVLALLHRLHRIAPCFPARLLPFRPQWDVTWNGAMLSLVDEADRALVQNCLATLRARTLPLLTPDVVVSGDPNPLNWGVLPSGQVVLFDWERVGLGPAAFDLAITVPGLGDKQAYQQVAAAYLSCEIVPVSSRAVDALARAIALCKVAVVCEFVGTLAHRSLTTAAQREWLRLQLPAWLCKLEAWTG